MIDKNVSRWLPDHRSTRRGKRSADTRNGYDFSERFPLIVAAVAALPVESCVVDGEAIACDERGLSV